MSGLILSQKEINRKAIEFATKEGLNLIAANDSHYVEPSGRLERVELLKGKHIDEWLDDYHDFKKQETVRRTSPKISRNAPCPCGSGKKYKLCCGRNG